jgi:hypothetical protein
VAVDVHALMQDADDVDDAVVGEAVVQGVRSGGELAVAGADVIAGAAEVRVRCGVFDGVLEFAQVGLGLVDIPVLAGVVEAFCEVVLGGGGEGIGSPVRFAGVLAGEEGIEVECCGGVRCNHRR